VKGRRRQREGERERGSEGERVSSPAGASRATTTSTSSVLPSETSPAAASSWSKAVLRCLDPSARAQFFCDVPLAALCRLSACPHGQLCSLTVPRGLRASVLLSPSKHQTDSVPWGWVWRWVPSLVIDTSSKGEVVQDAPIAVLSHTTQLSLPLPLPLSPVVCQFQPQYLDG
jgi:hypothetical protein